MVKYLKAFDDTLKEDFGKSKSVIYSLIEFIVFCIPLDILMEYNQNIFIQIVYIISIVIFLYLLGKGLYYSLKDDVKDFFERVSIKND